MSKKSKALDKGLTGIGMASNIPTMTAKLKKQAMNKLVKFISANQNSKKKLNAGQIREMVRLNMAGMHTLDGNETMAIYETFVNDKFAIRARNQKAIEYHQTELKKLTVK